MRRLRSGKIGIAMRADPGQQRQTSQHNETVDLVFILVTEGLTAR